MIEVSLEELTDWLRKAPIIATVHPLVPLCLPAGTSIAFDSQELRRAIDDPSVRVAKQVMLLASQGGISQRLPHLSVREIPSAYAINQRIADNLDYARSHLLTTRQIAAHIESDVSAHHFDTVVVLFVDGLSYQDVTGWPCELTPCFIDGPSVTFRFKDENKSEPVKSIGFPAIVGRPSIYSRLYRQGYRNARGYTYWNRSNAVADFMFTGIPYERVANFETVLQLLANENNLENSYIQIVREGLDGLAHSKRELRRVEIEASVLGILSDIHRLMEVLHERRLRACIYVAADHGILWKTEHSFILAPGVPTNHPRYAIHVPNDRIASEYAVRFEQEGLSYHLMKYPFLGTSIRANDSGVHGGLSYHESIVPFAKFEVNAKWN